MTCDRCKRYIAFGEPIYTTIPPSDAHPRLHEPKLCFDCAGTIGDLQKRADKGPGPDEPHNHWCSEPCGAEGCKAGRGNE